MLSFTSSMRKEIRNTSQSRSLIRLALALMFVLTGLFIFSCKDQGPYAITEGSPAPSLSLPDMKGKTVSLSQYKGKAIFLEFWATWCPPCRDSVPELNKLNKHLAGKDVVLLTISVDEGATVRETLNEFITENGINYPVLIGNEEVENKYGITNIPALFLFDRQHRFVKKYIGPVPVEDLIKDMEKIL